MELLARLDQQRDKLLSREEPELTEEQQAVCRMVAARIARESGIPLTISSVLVNKALTHAMRYGYLMGQDSLFGSITD